MLKRVLARHAAPATGTTPDAYDTAPASHDQREAEAPAAPRMAPVPYPVPADAESAALIALKATLTAGNPLSQNKLIEKFGLTRSAAQRVRKLALAEAGGSARRPELPARAE